MSEAAVAELVAISPRRSTQPRELPKYFSIREVDFPDVFLGTKHYWTAPCQRS